jgi:hypothetical protein
MYLHVYLFLRIENNILTSDHYKNMGETVISYSIKLQRNQFSPFKII